MKKEYIYAFVSIGKSNFKLYLVFKEANKEITKSKGIEEEYNFLFNTEPLSEEFYEKYFPYMKIAK